MLSSSFRRTALLSRNVLGRSFASGPASGGTISDEMLEKLGSLSTQALVDGLWVMGWPSAQIDGARPLTSGMKCAGRAVTLNFVPARPDIAQDKPAGGDSPEYEAFELCGPNEVCTKLKHYDSKSSDSCIGVPTSSFLLVDCFARISTCSLATYIQDFGHVKRRSCRERRGRYQISQIETTGNWWIGNRRKRPRHR